MDLQLEGKRAIVTGGSRGIGRAVAHQLAAEGVDVAIVARGRDALEDAAAQLAAATGRRVVAVVADTGDDRSVATMVQTSVEALGGVDILVNSAAQPMGQAPPPALADITTDIFWSDVNVKVMGYLRCAQAVAPLMVEQRWGRIINISGLGARTTGSIVGSMRNVAVAAMTKNLADQLGRHGVNVTVVHPGLTRTEKTPSVVASRAALSGVEHDEVERQMGASTTLGRIIDADEVAWVVTFLASPRSVAINGDAIACGGGSPGAIHY
jgi:NAD(P)-dependent dehydrogenase (short-subunit alcohol dehydrogenase family)